MNVADIKAGVIYHGPPRSHTLRVKVDEIYDDPLGGKRYAFTTDVCLCDTDDVVPENWELDNLAEWAQGVWKGELL